ncbi:MAG: thiol:disulfide interchange protein DsbA/DsbL [Candidatus Aphodousia sp.]|nr:thiol:disulfide interchange protein DsbA/DsbL [Sutterella sp.]MDY2899640.1 thiol:disulfide interchange protein DsbA/DsbL [Candidatus Aphodousia sp.]
MRRLFLALGMTLALATNAIAATDSTQEPAYRLVEPTVQTSTKTIEVLNFFAYTCGHCQRLAPFFDHWAKTAPKDVTIHNIPVAWDASTAFLSRIYYTFEALGRLQDLHPLFWQDLLDGKIAAESDLQTWLKTQGVDRKTWDNAYRSFSVSLRVQQASELWQAYKLDATPYIGVAGKYLTAPHMAGSYQKTLTVLNELIDLERRNRAKQ